MNTPSSSPDNRNRLHASCRVALAALLHDLGKFAERARPEVNPEMLENNVHQYCPYHQQHSRDTGWFSHKHAAYTGLAFDQIERLLPNLRDDAAPFGATPDDSLINAAARHHRPETYLQWLIATADRVASGFEREEFEQYNAAPEQTITKKNHYTARLLTLFEQIQSAVPEQPTAFLHRYRLKPMSPAALFPTTAQDYEPADNDSACQEYARLWQGFQAALAQIPPLTGPSCPCGWTTSRPCGPAIPPPSRQPPRLTSNRMFHFMIIPRPSPPWRQPCGVTMRTWAMTWKRSAAPWSSGLTGMSRNSC